MQKRLVLSFIALLSLQATPKIRGAVDLTIGGSDAAEEYTFGRIAGLAQASDGRIFVADAQDQEIRVYSPAGKFLFRFGAKGAGPGEFQMLGALAFGPDGLLWTRDEGNFRYQSFAITGTKAEYRSSRRMLQNMRGSHSPIVFSPKGDVVEIGRPNSQTASPYQYTLTVVDAEGKAGIADTTVAPPDDSIGVRYIRVPPNDSCREGCMVGRYLYQPFAPLSVVAVAPNGEWVQAITSRYAISWTTLDGKRVRLLQREVQGAVPTAKERAAADKRFDEMLDFVKMTRATAPFGMPSRKPVLDGMQFSTDGDLWVQRTTPADAPQEADVYDKNGRLVAFAEWPAKLRLLSFQTSIIGRSVLAVDRDSLDVERVVRLRFR